MVIVWTLLLVLSSSQEDVNGDEGYTVCSANVTTTRTGKYKKEFILSIGIIAPDDSVIKYLQFLRPWAVKQHSLLFERWTNLTDSLSLPFDIDYLGNNWLRNDTDTWTESIGLLLYSDSQFYQFIEDEVTTIYQFLNDTNTCYGSPLVIDLKQRYEPICDTSNEGCSGDSIEHYSIHLGNKSICSDATDRLVMKSLFILHSDEVLKLIALSCERFPCQIRYGNCSDDVIKFSIVHTDDVAIILSDVTVSEFLALFTKTHWGTREVFAYDGSTLAVTQEQEKVCHRGEYNLGNICTPCPLNTYSSTSSANRHCTPCLWNGVTLAKGASSAAMCYSNADIHNLLSLLTLTIAKVKADPCDILNILKRSALNCTEYLHLGIPLCPIITHLLYLFETLSLNPIVKPTCEKCEGERYSWRNGSEVCRNCAGNWYTGPHTCSSCPRDILPLHRTFDSALPMYVNYTINCLCDVNYIVRGDYDILSYRHDRIEHKKKDFVTIRTSNNSKSTTVSDEYISASHIMSGNYYHACGVHYSNHSDNTSTNVTEYLFFPFKVTIIDMSNIAWSAQTRDDVTQLYFYIQHTDVGEPVENITIISRSQNVTTNVSTLELSKVFSLDGPAASNLTFNRGMTSLMIRMAIPPNQPNGTTIHCYFNVGQDTFSMVSVLGEVYDTVITDIIYMTGDLVNVSIRFVEIPLDHESTFTLSQPFSARNVIYNQITSLINTGNVSSLGRPLYNYTVYMSHDLASVEMAGYYDVTLEVPSSDKTRTFLTFPLTIIHITDVKVSVEETMNAEFQLVLTDYTDYKVINITNMSWDSNITDKFTVSEVTKAGFRAYQATGRMTSARMSDAGSYKFTFDTLTGEHFTGNLEIKVFTISTFRMMHMNDCPDEYYTNPIYGPLHWSTAESDTTSVVACAYRSVEVTNDTASRECFNGTWGDVNQTLCGSKESYLLRNILHITMSTTNSSQLDLTNYDVQIKYVARLRDYFKENISKLAGSDLTAVNSILEEVTHYLDNGSIYFETVEMFADMMQYLVADVNSDAVSLYNIPDLNLRDTASTFARAVYNNNTGKIVVFNRTQFTMIMGPLNYHNKTEISSSLRSSNVVYSLFHEHPDYHGHENDEVVDVLMPHHSLLFSKNFTKPNKGIIVTVYYNASHAYPIKADPTKFLISPAVEIVLAEEGRHVSNLSTPIVITFRVMEKIIDKTAIDAVFYDTVTNEWKTDGCVTNVTGEYIVIAYCNHITGFAIQKTNRISKTNEQKVCSHISAQFTAFGGSILFLFSIVFLVVALILVIRPIRTTLKKHTMIHTHGMFAATMLIADVIIFFVISISTNECSDEGGCGIVVFVGHVLWLSVQAWLVVEGITLNTLVTKGFRHNIERQVIKSMLGVFSFPLLMAIVCYVTLQDENDYFDQTIAICWLSPNGMFYFFWIPILILFLLTLVVFVKVLYELRDEEQKSTEDEINQMKNTLVALTLLLLLFTTGWVCGAVSGVEYLNDTFTNIDGLGNIIFIVMNMIQALTVLVFLILLDGKVRAGWRKKRRDETEEDETSSSDTDKEAEEEPTIAQTRQRSIDSMIETTDYARSAASDLLDSIY